MKKLFFLAATAMLFAACTSDELTVQDEVLGAATSDAVGFDVYTASATRAGDPEGVMTTDKLKTLEKGFGVFAMYQDNAIYNSSLVPNFMYNEHVSWSAAGGWTYPILKYWPNETTQDSQDPAATAPALDKLSFFAYAPYVTTGAAPLASKADNYMVATYNAGYATVATNYDKAYNGSETYGILSVSAEDRTGDPLVEWGCHYAIGSTKENEILDKNVDLLWGVAAKDADYTAVNGSMIDTEFGKPLLNLVKPDKEQKVKFLFQHALSRIGLTVVSSIDQIAAGDDGGKYNNAQTRVLIEDVKVWGDFGIRGVLNLNNGTANVANWQWPSVLRKASTETDPILAVNTANDYLASDLRYDQTVINGIIAASPTKAFTDLNEGVLPSEKNLLKAGPDPGKKVTSPAYAVGTVYYNADGTIATTTATDNEAVIYKEDGDDLVKVGNAGASVLDGSETLYKVVTTGPITSGTLTAGTAYYMLDGDDYIKITADGTETAPDASHTYYLATNVTKTELEGNAYSGDVYTAMMPRYFMVIPSALPATDETKTTVNVKITYRVITSDAKLNTTISNVQNVITKQAKFQFESGKSYNLKLILGLTSVKLDAVVGEWQVGDDAEIWLPKNND